MDDAAARVHISKQYNESSPLTSSVSLSEGGSGEHLVLQENGSKLYRTPDSYSRCSPEINIALYSSRNVTCLSSLIFLLEKYRGEVVIVSLSTGHVLSPRPAACSWFSLSNDFGLAAVIITQLGSGKSCPVADACLIAVGCVRRLEDLL